MIAQCRCCRGVYDVSQVRGWWCTTCAAIIHECPLVTARLNNRSTQWTIRQDRSVS